MAICGLNLAADATSDSGVIDVLRLNAGAAAGLTQGAGRQRLVNASTQSDMRILFNGGYFAMYNAFSCTYMFTTTYNVQNPSDVPQGKGGRAVVLESVDGNLIDLRFVNGGLCWPCNGKVNFRGEGDVRLNADGAPTYIYGWCWNQHGSSWQQTGDLRLTGCFRLVCETDDSLPYAAANGIVRVEGNKYCYLDMKGHSAKLNGLVVAGATCITNSSSAAATLTLGLSKPDAVLSVSHAGGGLITASFVGAGTLSVSNTPAFPAINVQSGTLRVKGNCSVRRLTLQKNVNVIIDGGALTVTEAFTDRGATYTYVNGGRMDYAINCATDQNVTIEAAETVVTSIKKSGTGRVSVYSSGKVGANLHVAAGTVGFAVWGTTNHWLRFTFKGMVSGQAFQLSEMLLMNSAGNRVDGGGSVVNITEGTWAGKQGSAVKNVDYSCAPKDMPAQSIWASDQSWINAEPEGAYRDRTPSAIFDGAPWTRLRYNTSCSASSPKTFVIRLPQTTTDLYCYNFRNGYSNTAHPSAWTVETSPDGLVWSVCDDQIGQQPPFGTQQFYNSGTHYLISAGKLGGAGLVAGANVRVDRGATFDASGVAGGQCIDRLTVDCAVGTGDGTLKNVRLAATGTVDLLNITRGTVIPLPLAFVDSVTTGDLAGWAVTIKGIAKPGYRLMWLNDRLTVYGPGMRIVIR